MPRIIWSTSENQTKLVSDALGIERWQLRNALQIIKEEAGMSGTDRVIVWDDGTVSDTQGNPANVYDEI